MDMRRLEMMELLRFFNNLSMWKKQLISFLIIILIPYGVALSLAASMGRIALENATEQANNAVERVSLRIEQVLSIAVSVSSNIAYDANLRSLITADFEDNFSRIRASWDSGNLLSYFIEHTDKIDGLFMYSDKYRVLNTGYLKDTPEHIRSENWYKSASEKGTGPFWAYIPSDSFARRKAMNLALCRGIYGGTEFLGVLCVYINSAALEAIAGQEDFEVVLCDPAGRIVAAKDGALEGVTLGEAGISLDASLSTQRIEYRGEPFSVISRNIAIPETRGQLRVIALYSNDLILSRTRGITTTAYMTILAGCGLSVFIVFLVSKLLTNRLVKVSTDIHRVAGGELDFTPSLDGLDEIGQLSKDLNVMLENLRMLISENYAIKLQKRELESHQKDIQLNVLSSQINPHFLFNALESIRMKAVIDGGMEIAGAIRTLSLLMRKSLLAGSAPIPLSEELELVRNYLDVQKMRFDERLNYRTDIRTELDGQTILPLLLQPIVENAIRHGIEESARGEGYVAVGVSRDGGALVIHVADNGAGMSAETLREVKAIIKSPPDDIPAGHIGIVNVSRRIRLKYGDAYGLDIRSEPGKGTIVTLRLPYT